MAILVKAGLSSVSLPAVNPDHESVFCKINISGNHIVIAGIYRPPGAPCEFLLELYDHLAVYKDQNIIAAGDFNLPHIDWCSMSSGGTDTKNSEILLDTLLAYNLTQTVLYPTRVTSTASSILDLILCSASFTDHTTEIHEGVSDHKLVYFSCKLPNRIKLNNAKFVKVKDYNAADNPNIAHHLEEALLTFHDDDVNVLWAKFKSCCNYCINKFIPDKMKKINKANPWITREIIHLKRKLKRYRKRKNRDAALLFKLSSKLKSKLREAKERFYSTTLGRFATESPHKFWQFLSNKDSRSVDQIAVGARIVTDKKEIAETFNSYFQSVFSRPATLGNTPYVNDSNQYIHITVEGVTELLLRLDPKKSAGPDNIPTAFLKRYAELLARFLVQLYSKSLETSCLPLEWLVARVKPIFKKGSVTDYCNYRPISLTCTVCKVLEHVIAKHLNDFLDNNNLLTNVQHGFRRGFSTATQLVVTVHEMAQVLDEGGQIDAVLIDFSKAFDRVPHSKLITKMKNLGIPSQVVNWVISYLTGRKQYVEIDGACSRFLDVFSGVPQGSVLAPVLFNIYINDLGQIVKPPLRLKLFADDCIIFSHIVSAADQHVLNHALHAITEWCNKWDMLINLDKTVHMCISNKNKSHFMYSLGNYQIKQVEEHKYLGLTLTSRLNWSTHINNICSSARKKLGFLKHKLGDAPSSLRLIAYKSIVRPTLEYGSIVWDPHTITNKEKLEKIQRLAARFIYKRFRRRDSPSAMLELAHLEPLANRRKSARLNFLHQLYFNKLGIQSQDYIANNPSRASRHKHSRSITPFFARTDQYKYSFFPRTVSDWNVLPECSPLLSSNV